MLTGVGEVGGQLHEGILTTAFVLGQAFEHFLSQYANASKVTVAYNEMYVVD